MSSTEDTEPKETDKTEKMVEKSFTTEDDNVGNADKKGHVSPNADKDQMNPTESKTSTAHKDEIQKSDTKNGNNVHESSGGTITTDGRLPSGFEIIAIKEKHGQLRKAVPIMPLPLAIILCFFNVLLPGFGTLISAFTVCCGSKTEYESKVKSFGLNVIAALLQFVTLPILVGWIWSIIWGVTFITSALSRDDTSKQENHTVPPPEQV